MKTCPKCGCEIDRMSDCCPGCLSITLKSSELKAMPQSTKEALAKLAKHITKNPNAVALGRLGGKAGRGHVKARTSEQARQAVMVRWNKRKQVVTVPNQVGTCSACGKANVEIDHFGVCENCG